MGRLPEKQFLFVQEYLKDLNAKQAAIRAGYSPKTAEVQASRLLNSVKVQDALSEARKAQMVRTQITQDRVVAELAKIAFGDATAYARVVRKVDPDTLEDYQTVELTPTSDLTADQRAAVAQIKEGKHGIEVSRYDKMRALELLGRHLGMFDKHDAPEADQPDDGFLEALKGEAGEVWQD